MNMKCLIYGLVLCRLFAPQASAEPSSIARIVVHFEGFPLDKGALFATLCNRAGDKISDSNLVRLAPNAGRLTHVWANIPPGTYGIFALHDSNPNGRLDFNFFGAPNEQWGASHNPPPRMGPDLWFDIQFEVGEDGRTSTIDMH
jgi:uncharacterized protein (DUF2141 family)